MKRLIAAVLVLLITACKDKSTPAFTAQEIVDKSISASGGDYYKTSAISFDFRDRKYTLERVKGRRVMKRILKTDSSEVIDIKAHTGFQRLVNGKPVQVHDSMAFKYENSINSVHYFAYLPYGLNDPAVIKEYLGTITIKDKLYYKVKITFRQENGGKDYEDVFVYWFNAETFKPDYLAYEYFTDGGGLRLREAYNERIVNGIRFVDYNNLKPKVEGTSIFTMDSLYMQDQLELLSKIELRNINVSRDNYN